MSPPDQSQFTPSLNNNDANPNADTVDAIQKPAANKSIYP